MNTPIRHSGWGIASFILSLGSGLVLLSGIVLAGVMSASTPGGMDENAPSTILVGLVLMFGLLMGLIALAFSVVSLFQAQRRRVFGILGGVFSLAALVLVALLMVLGSLA